MGQKVHPIGFRIGVTHDHSSHWFAKADQYANLLHEDRIIRDYLMATCTEAGISQVQLSRKADRVEIEIHASRPVVILKGVGVDTIRTQLQSKISQPRQFVIQVVEISQPDLEAKLVAEFIGSQLEKRIPFRRAMKQGLKRAQRAGVTGMKIQVAGRLNGAEIARSEWVRFGRVPLQTLRANIDYCHHEAQTIYGILGIKVWVFKDDPTL